MLFEEKIARWTYFISKYYAEYIHFYTLKDFVQLDPDHYQNLRTLL